MSQIILLAAAIAAAILGSGLSPDFQGPMTSLIGCVLIAGALSDRSSREALFTLLRANAPVLIALLALAAAMLATSLLAPGDGGWRTRQTLVQLSLFTLGGASAGAIAAARGRSLTLLALSLAGVAAGFAAAAGAGHGRTAFGFFPPSLDAPALSAAFGMTAIMCCFAAADELRRRPAAGGRALPPLARRLFAPIAGLLTSFVMLLLTGSPLGLALAALGLLAFTGALALRARRSRVGLAIVPAAATVSIAAAALATLTAGAGGGLHWFAGATPPGADQTAIVSQALAAWRSRPLFGEGVGGLNAFQIEPDATASGLRLLSELGLVGVLAVIGVFGAFLIDMTMRRDRGRRLTRGFTLMAGVTAFAVSMSLLTPAFSSGAALLILAVLAGLAASYQDEPPAARSADPV